MATLRESIPAPIKNILRPIYRKIYNNLPKPWEPPTKHAAEIDFWQDYYKDRGNRVNTSWYKVEMLAMAEEASDEFLRGKIVADFGCGPMGSLHWAKSAAIRIGIDVLADQYSDLFTNSVLSSEMIYVKSTERTIPIPSNFVDVLFTMNAMDHVENFQPMCDEVLRILKPGGELIGSFNLEEPPTDCEPQHLTESMLKIHLLDKLEIRSYRVARVGPLENLRKNLLENNLEYNPGEHGILWVKALKK